MSSRAIADQTRRPSAARWRPGSRSVRWAAWRSDVTPLLQTKTLTIGPPNDRYEQEADRVADAVMRMPAPQETLSSSDGRLSRKCETCLLGKEACPGCREDEARTRSRLQISKIPSALQRQAEEEEEDEELIQRMPQPSTIPGHVQRQPVEEEEDEELLQAKARSGGVRSVSRKIAAQIDALQGGGQPLPESDRAFFEPRFGYDFSDVRVHTDARAAAAVQAVNARAFTVGRDLVFGRGAYTPHRRECRRLLAHELTHVVQQSNDRANRGVGRGTEAGAEQARRVNSSRKTIVQRQRGGKSKAPACTIPDKCPDDFCTPLPSVDDAQDHREVWWPILRQGISKFVDSRVVPLWDQYAWGGANPQNLSATFAKDFTASKTTKATNGDIQASITLKLRASPPTFPRAKNTVTVSVGSVIPGHIRALGDVKNAMRMNFDQIGEVPGNIAGDVGKDQLACKVGAKPSPFNDLRTLKGNLKIDLDPASNELTVTPQLKYLVKDTIDLCPGDCGAFKEQAATVSLSRWEATGISGDVPFSVEFDASIAPFRLVLSKPPPRAKPPASSPKKKRPPVEVCDAKENAPVVVPTKTPGRDRIVKLPQGTPVEVLKKIPGRTKDGKSTVWYRVKMLGGPEPNRIGLVQKRYLENCRTS